MSKSTKRKHVVQEFRSSEYSVPTAEQEIVQLVEGRGNNLHSVQRPDGSEFLVSMPSKFRKNVWTKRGDFLIVDVISEGGKVRGEISTILDPVYVKFLKKNDCWPAEFAEKPVTPPTSESNRRTFEFSESSSDSD